MSTAFDEMVNNLVAMRVPRDKAEAAARRELGLSGSGADLVAVDDDALEDVHVEEADRTVRALGFTVVRNSQKRRSKVTPGIPDRKYYHTGRRLTFWYEGKATWGTQSPAQREFQAIAEACGEIYVLGTHDDLVKWLCGHRIAQVIAGVLEPIPYDNLPI